MKEVRREHHSVSSVPELRLILIVELEHVSASHEPETRENHVSGEEPDEQAGVVEWSVAHAYEAREDGSLHCNSLVHHEPPVVCELHDTTEAMAAHLALSNFKRAKKASDRTTTLSEALIDQVLQATCSAENPTL